MTATELARLLRARRSGKGRWMARCPAHRERTGSLSITDMGGGRTRLHCFVGCAQSDVLRAAGLSWRDLRPGNVTPVIRERMALGDEWKRLERTAQLVRFGMVGLLKERSDWWPREPINEYGKKVLTNDVSEGRRFLEELSALARREIAPAKEVGLAYLRAVGERVRKEMEARYWQVMPDAERTERIMRFEMEDYRQKRLDRLYEKEA